MLGGKDEQFGACKTMFFFSSLSLTPYINIFSSSLLVENEKILAKPKATRLSKITVVASTQCSFIFRSMI